MNRLDHVKGKFYANGMQVSEMVWIQAGNQNDRLSHLRGLIRQGQVYRPWNMYRRF